MSGGIDLNRNWEAPWPTTFVGQTANVKVSYQSAMGAPAAALAKQMLQVVEIYYGRLAAMFAAKNKQKIWLVISSLSSKHDGMGGGYHLTTMGTSLFCDVKLDPASKTYLRDFTSFVFVAEAAEVFAAYEGAGYDDSKAQDEALSRVLANIMVPGQTGVYGTAVDWLNYGRGNFIDTVMPATKGIYLGCCVSFYYWLHHQCKLPWDAIVQANTANVGSVPLENVAKRLGHPGAYKSMLAFVDKKYPRNVFLDKVNANENLFD